MIPASDQLLNQKVEVQHTIAIFVIELDTVLQNAHLGLANVMSWNPYAKRLIVRPNS